LTGDALDAYTRLSDDDAAKYATVKEALLLCYNFTDKGYRQRFRQCRPKPAETPRQFVERLTSYLRKWVQLSGKGVEELIIQEQFLDACPKELATYLEEQKQQDLDELIEAANRYLKAHNKTFGPPKKHFQKCNHQENQVNKDHVQDKPSPPQDRKRGCYTCNSPDHKAANCPNGGKSGRQQNNTSGGARPRASGNPQPAGGSIITSDGTDANNTYVDATDADIHQCLKDGRLLLPNGTSIPMITGPVKSSLCTKGLLTGKEVTIMRDTGCSGVVVKKDLVPPPEDLTGDNDTVVLANGMCVSGPAAVVQIDTPY
jgi:hypothetical protein